MTLLHGYFTTRNQQAFQRLLASSTEAATTGYGVGSQSTSSSSWKKPSSLTSALSASILVDVNARDYLGRTVLHLACSTPTLECSEYVRLLLKHPHINVNLADHESHWTALHRALYNGDIAIVVLLLQHPSIDLNVKDLEGYTPYDLYNSSVEDTKPDPMRLPPPPGIKYDLCTWGTNRNASLGQGDASDRPYPDPVILLPTPGRQARITEDSTLKARFAVHHVHQLAMSKLHTVVVTDEPSGQLNLRVCGFGSGGRLGSAQHTQYALIPLNTSTTHTIIWVAVGQDHTLAMTNTGEVLSWGLNRFSQLGYVIESTSSRPDGDQIQATPRRVLGPLKKEYIRGVAASKCASCAWTSRGELYTWGTNHGQLGYDHVAQPIQVQPRKASRITKPVIDVAMTDSAMICLLETEEVICVWRDLHFKLNFPSLIFPKAMEPYRLPPAFRQHRVDIQKVVADDEGSFAALTTSGEVFTFSVPQQTDNTLTKEDIKPQLAWALRKQFTAVRDVALGVEGSIILCTESGHVYIRDRTAPTKKNAGIGNWVRLPYIQRAVRVCANSAGSFAVLRQSSVPADIPIQGPTVQEDIVCLAPFLWLPQPEDTLFINHMDSLTTFSYSLRPETSPIFHEDEDVVIRKDVHALSALARFLSYAKTGLPNQFPMSADILVRVDNICVPVHRAVLALGSTVLNALLCGQKVPSEQTGISVKYRVKDSGVLPCVSISNVQPLSVLLLLFYFYADDIPTIWDLRVLSLAGSILSSMRIRGGVDAVRRELILLTKEFHLPALMKAIETPSKRTPPSTLVTRLGTHFDIAQQSSNLNKSFADVKLQLADETIYTHSVLLQARSPFFSSFFGNPVWTTKRRNPDESTLEVDLRHLRWHSMKYVLRFMLCGEEKMFGILPFIRTVDDLIEFMFEVMGAANELLLGRLVLICSRIILNYVNIQNACYILTDATHYHAVSLIDRVQGYIAINLETFLENNVLLDLAPPIVKQLSQFVREKQSQKMKFTKMQEIIANAMKKHADWLAKQDFPEPIFRSQRNKVKDSPRLSPKLDRKRSIAFVPPSSPLQRLPEGAPDSDIPTLLDDDIFLMDETELPSATLSPLAQGIPPVWKLSSTPRVDMKSVMEETTGQSLATVTSGTLSAGLKFSQRPSQRDRRKAQVSAALPTNLPTSTPTPSRNTSSPWKSIPQASSSIISSTPPPLSTPPPAPRPISSSSILPNRPRPQPQSSPSQLGHIFAPPRQPASPSNDTPRRVPSGSGKVWASPPVPSPVAPVNNGGVSLVAIQQLQLEQSTPAKAISQSILDIQREEAEQQREVDFLKWWAQEEVRVQKEESLCQTSHLKKGSSRKKSAGKTRRGKDTQGTETMTHSAIGSHKGQPKQKKMSTSKLT